MDVFRVSAVVAAVVGSCLLGTHVLLELLSSATSASSAAVVGSQHLYMSAQCSMAQSFAAAAIYDIAKCNLLLLFFCCHAAIQSGGWWWAGPLGSEHEPLALSFSGWPAS